MSQPGLSAHFGTYLGRQSKNVTANTFGLIAWDMCPSVPLNLGKVIFIVLLFNGLIPWLQLFKTLVTASVRV